METDAKTMGGLVTKGKESSKSLTVDTESSGPKDAGNSPNQQKSKNRDLIAPEQMLIPMKFNSNRSPQALVNYETDSDEDFSFPSLKDKECKNRLLKDGFEIENETNGSPEICADLDLVPVHDFSQRDSCCNVKQCSVM